MAQENNNYSYEQKRLVLKDLSARQCYGVILKKSGSKDQYANLAYVAPNKSFLFPVYVYDDDELCVTPYDVEDWKPVLRKIESMTEAEKNELFYKFNDKCAIIGSYCVDCNNHWSVKGRTEPLGFQSVSYESMRDVTEWFYKNGFDINGLIPQGLAEEATEEIYKKV